MENSDYITAKACLKKPLEENFDFGDWKFKTSKGHILSTEQEESYKTQLKLPHFPDMLFGDNLIQFEHSSGFGINLNALDALKHVNDHEDLVKVAMAEKWKEARKESPHLNNIVHPFDWTYTPFGYKGTQLEKTMKVSETDEKINYQKLQEKEKILFYEEVILYEDELDDNGCSLLSAKLRVMPSGFFCLLRFYLRVDNTLVRVIDSRFYHEIEKKYILREYTERESKTSDLQVPPVVWRDANEIANHLEVNKEITERLDFP